jgi:hypothetical protein
MYVSASISDGAGRLKNLEILVGQQEESSETGIPATLSLQAQRNIRQQGDVRLVLKGTPNAAVKIDRYSCDLASAAKPAGTQQ